jgi:hypothetical protein
MAAERPAPFILAAAWLALTGFAPPRETALPYDLAALINGSAAGVLPPVEPGEQYPTSQRERVVSPPSAAAAAPVAPQPRRTSWTLTVDASVTGDSNITNGTGLDTIFVDGGSGPANIPVDPAFREKAAVGLGASASASLRTPIGGGATLAFDAESYAIRYPGEAGNDDSSALVAGGIALAGGGGSGVVQVTAFDRWYGGDSAMRGLGVRGNWRQDVEGGGHVALYVDARTFESDWGDPLTGRSASLYLSYDKPLDATFTAAGGIYGRRDWMRDDAFSNLELGAYGSLTHYLGKALTGGISAGLSRSWYDAPLVYLSPDERRDWRAYGSLWITTRKPVALGFYPSLTYTYNRTSSSVSFYKADRHRLRLGVSRSF